MAGTQDAKLASIMLESTVLRKQLCVMEFRKADKKLIGSIAALEVEAAAQNICSLLGICPFSEDVTSKASELVSWNHETDALDRVTAKLSEAEFLLYIDHCLRIFSSEAGGMGTNKKQIAKMLDESQWAESPYIIQYRSPREPEAEAAPENASVIQVASSESPSFLWAVVGYGWIWGGSPTVGGSDESCFCRRIL